MVGGCGCGCGCVRIKILFECLDSFGGGALQHHKSSQTPTGLSRRSQHGSHRGEECKHLHLTDPSKVAGCQVLVCCISFLPRKKKKRNGDDKKNANKLWGLYCHVYCLSVWVPTRILVPCSLWSRNENLDKISSFELSITNMILYYIYWSTWANVSIQTGILEKTRYANSTLPPTWDLRPCLTVTLQAQLFQGIVEVPDARSADDFVAAGGGQLTFQTKNQTNDLSRENEIWYIVRGKLVNWKSLLKTLSNQTKPSTSSKLCKPPESSAPKSVYNITECGAVCHRSWASTQERNAVVPDP